MITREKLAAALATVDGLAASETQPDTVVPGCAWPVWSTTSWRNQCVQERQWFVFVVLPAGDLASSVQAGDAIVGDVFDVLAALPVRVQTVEPVRLVLELGQAGVPALRYTIFD